MKLVTLTVGAFLIPLLVSCSGSLAVKTANGELPGIPFKETSTYVRSGLLMTHSKLPNCVPAPFEQTVVLATGETRYLSIDGATFAKTALTVKFNDNGVLKELSFNNEPAGGESFEKLVGGIEKLLPFAGLLPATSDQDDSDDTLPGFVPVGPSCDTGPTNVIYSQVPIR